MSTLHVTGGPSAWLATLARVAEPFRTERVAELAIVALVYLAHAHPESASSATDAIVWVVGAVAGRSAVHAGAGAIASRPAPVSSTTVAVAVGDPPTSPGVSR